MRTVSTCCLRERRSYDCAQTDAPRQKSSPISHRRAPRVRGCIRFVIPFISATFVYVFNVLYVSMIVAHGTWIIAQTRHSEVGTSETFPADCRGHLTVARERVLSTLRRRSELSRQELAESSGAGLNAMPLFSESAPNPSRSWRSSSLIFCVFSRRFLPHEFFYSCTRLDCVVYHNL